VQNYACDRKLILFFLILNYLKKPKEDVEGITVCTPLNGFNQKMDLHVAKVFLWCAEVSIE
jgi:hypothetical protein